ncbi:uncharacterized protein LOC142658933 [Rhinoderma darwinii]|uniref:uncharacterized protein LOC142658933 n=1 Tax=Rhinoderma darwinii TaxID=43563 RepID=UPI003F662F4B
MRPGNGRDKTYTWLEYMVGTDPRLMTQLPSIYLKCTSMIMDTMNFSIDYSAPFTSNLLHNSYNPRALQVKSPSQRSISGYQVLPSGRDSNNKILHQKGNTRSNVKMTLQYLGTGFSITNEIINPKDELSMFQQICGGESICVFRGYLSPGDTFQIISRRHHGYPFSASIYINGLIAARISWCCEYRHNVGFQQGRGGCFRISQLSGGKPCYRCVEIHKKYQTRPGRNPSSGSSGGGSVTSEENVLGGMEISANHTEEKVGNIETVTWGARSLHPTPPNTRSTPPARRRRRRKKNLSKEGSDSEQENKDQDKSQNPRRRRRRGALGVTGVVKPTTGMVIQLS